MSVYLRILSCGLGWQTSHILSLDVDLRIPDQHNSGQLPGRVSSNRPKHFSSSSSQCRRWAKCHGDTRASHNPLQCKSTKTAPVWIWRGWLQHEFCQFERVSGLESGRGVEEVRRPLHLISLRYLHLMHAPLFNVSCVDYYKVDSHTSKAVPPRFKVAHSKAGKHSTEYL